MLRRAFLSLFALAFSLPLLRRWSPPRPPWAGEGWEHVRGSWVAFSVPALARQLNLDLRGGLDGHDVAVRAGEARRQRRFILA